MNLLYDMVKFNSAKILIMSENILKNFWFSDFLDWQNFLSTFDFFKHPKPYTV